VVANVARTAVVTPLRSQIERARQAFVELERWIMSPTVLEQTFDEVEREHERRGREALRQLLQAHIEKRGTGDVGRAVEVVVKDSEGTETVRLGEHRLHDRTIHSIFGEVEATRTAYYAEGTESVHPLDEAAAFPARTFSYEIQRRAILGSIQGPFDEAVERVKESTGVLLSKRSVEQIAVDAATDFVPFYAARELPPPTETGPIVVLSLDGKGVPMVKPERALRVVRRASGKKANKKRMATVAAVFTQQPRIRTPEEVLESLFHEGPRPVANEREAPRWPGPEHKRIWASLEKSKDEVIDEVVQELAARDPKGKKRRAILIDGEQALQRRAAKAIHDGVEILDLLHVIEKIWKCAYCFHPEGSDEAKEWARARILQILRGEVSQVVKGIRCSATMQGLADGNRATVDAVTGYLYRNRRRMRYDEYLREGLPIASGAVEGACKNLVRDRMERSGMRWTIKGGEAMLRLRAIYLSGDFDAYWAFHMRREQERLHPVGSWRVVEK
jgi:hypothetical protein